VTLKPESPSPWRVLLSATSCFRLKSQQRRLAFPARVLSFLLIFVACLPINVTVTAQTEPIPAIESLEVQTQAETLKKDLRDLRAFYEMDDPREAAKALREHVQRQGISLDALLAPRRDELGAGEPKATQRKSEADELIHVFNATEFVPSPGVESTLSVRAERLKAESRGEEQLVCILQLQSAGVTMGNVIELLETGVKVYELVGRTAAIVRLPASAIAFLQLKPYVRWIGDYKPEYKYNPTHSTSRRSGVFIYTLAGDKPEYRADLGRLGISVRRYDKSAGLYEVILDVSRFREVAENLWWVKRVDDEIKEWDEHIRERNAVVSRDSVAGSRGNAPIVPSASQKLSQSSVQHNGDDDCEKARSRSRFPERPELFRPMPFPRLDEKGEASSETDAAKLDSRGIEE